MQHGITQREPKSEPCTPIGARVQQSQGWYNNVSVTPVKHAEVAAQGKDRSGLGQTAIVMNNSSLPVEVTPVVTSLTPPSF
jgi:hypothetical protein